MQFILLTEFVFWRSVIEVGRKHELFKVYRVTSVLVENSGQDKDIDCYRLYVSEMSLT